MDHEQNDGRMELKSRALEPGAERQVVMDPALREPVPHDGIHAKRGRDGGSLKILALARGVLGQDSDGHVEARKTGETAQNEKGEADRVGNSTEAKSKGHHSWGDTEGDLTKSVASELDVTSHTRRQTYQISERVQLLAHQAALLPPASHLSIEKVKEQAERKEGEREPDVVVYVGVTEAVS